MSLLLSNLQDLLNMITESINELILKKRLFEIYVLVKSELTKSAELSEKDKIGLYSGNMGAVLFLYEYGQFDTTSIIENNKLIFKLVDEACECIKTSKNLSRSLFDGLCGTLCTINFLKEKKLLKINNNYISAEIVEYLENGSLKDTLESNHCDLLHGGFGFLLYLTENPHLPNWQNLVQNQLNALKQITVSFTNNRINWRLNTNYLTVDHLNYDNHGVNLGLAHGISGIVILLSKLKKMGYSTKYVEDNIRDGMQLILSTKLENIQSVSLYPSAVLNDTPILDNGLAWCNGDLCIALACWHAWEATENYEYREAALEIIDFTCKMDPKNAYVTEFSICHGSAGISHILRKFYWETNNELYKNVSDYWINETLKIKLSTRGTTKNNKYIIPENPKLELGMLSGLTGIGLTLISAITNKRSNWARYLLID